MGDIEEPSQRAPSLTTTKCRQPLPAAPEGKKEKSRDHLPTSRKVSDGAEAGLGVGGKEGVNEMDQEEAVEEDKPLAKLKEEDLDQEEAVEETIYLAEAVRDGQTGLEQGEESMVRPVVSVRRNHRLSCQTFKNCSETLELSSHASKFTNPIALVAR